jgi:creatinine amidohydrolase
MLSIAYGFTRVLVMSGHVTNAAALRCALEELRAAHPNLQIAQKHICEVTPQINAEYSADAEDWHANAAETALMMHFTPQLVRENRIFDDEDRTRELAFSYAVPHTSKAGHTGAPSLATTEMGARLFEKVVAEWANWTERALIEKPPLEIVPLSQTPREYSHDEEAPETPEAQTLEQQNLLNCGPPLAP